MHPSEAYADGWQVSTCSLAAWRKQGHLSLEACRRYMQQCARYEIQHARQHLFPGQRGQDLRYWQRHLAYSQGYLDALG